MASGTRSVLKVLAGCSRQLLSAGETSYTRVSLVDLRHHPPARTFTAVKTQKKPGKKSEKEKVVKEKKVAVEGQGSGRRPAPAPVDDVYVLKHYPRQVHDAPAAVALLKGFQLLDFSPRDQPVYIDLRLDMKLEKKKKVDAFVSTLVLPHPLRREPNRVVVFTENPDQAQLAQENGAALTGGSDLVQRILDGEIDADFYIADPDMLPKLLPLKNKLRKKFPKSKRGSVGKDVLKMLELFRMGHEYMVESDCYVRTQIGTLDMPQEHLLANLQALVLDTCSHRPASFSGGHFIERAIIASQTSEALWFHSEDVLPKPPEETEVLTC